MRRMWTRTRRLIALVICTLALCTSTGLASDGAKDIRVYFRNIRLVVNGVQVTPADAEPFILDGRTYVPLRTVAETLGHHVQWDGDNSKVLINSSANLTPLGDLVILNESGMKPVATKQMNGVTYPRSIALWGCGSAFTELALNAQYSNLEALIGTDESAGNSAQVVVTVDDRTVSEFSLVPNAKPVKVTANVAGALKMRIATRGCLEIIAAGSVSK